jgi:hypothetical protein
MAGVDDQHGVAIRQPRRQGCDVQALAGQRGDLADVQHAGPRVARRLQVVDLNPPAARRNYPRLDTERLQTQQRVSAGGVVLVGNHHVVPGLPLDRRQHPGDAFRCAADQRMVAGRQARQGRQPLLDLQPDVPVPLIAGGTRGLIGGIGLERGAVGFQQGRLPAGCQVNTAVFQADEIGFRCQHGGECRRTRERAKRPSAVAAGTERPHIASLVR